MRSTLTRRITRMLVLLAVPLLLAPALTGALPGAAEAAAESDGRSGDSAVALLRQASEARAEIIGKVLPSVVHINVVKTVEREVPEFFKNPMFRRFFGPQMPPEEFQRRGLGTGFIVSADGYILTNNHVVAKADEITVKLRDGRELSAELVGTDPATDLAVIKVDAADLPAVTFADSQDVRVGETVIAIGNPFGLEQTVTQGIISAKGRSQLGLTDYEDFIQTDAPINPGNSGGPLIDLDGEVVAVNTAIFSQSGGSMGIGFAIPSNLARHIMTALIEEGEVSRGFLGINIQDVTPELSEALGIDRDDGVLVAGVGESTPAAEAGLRQGDVITAFNERPVSTANALRVRVAREEPGTEVPVTVLRDGSERTLTVTLGERPEKPAAALRGQRPGQGEPEGPATPERELGLAVAPLTPELAERLGYEGLQGVVVRAVKPGGAAAQAGLRRGALIEAVNKAPVGSVEALREALREADSGDKLLLRVRMGASSRFLVLEAP